MKVYKLKGESPDISESSIVFKDVLGAMESIREWEGFLGMETEEALDTGEVWIEEWELR